MIRNFSLIWFKSLALCILETPLMGTFTNSEDPDENAHNMAFHQGLHCLLSKNPSSGTEIHHNWEMPTFDP